MKLIRSLVVYVFLYACESWTLTADLGQETEAERVWSCLNVFWSSKDNPTRHSERKKKKKEANKRRGGKTISKSGQEWNLPTQLGQLETGQDGKMDGWIICDFTSFSTVFQSCEDNGQMIIKGCVQWNTFTVEKISP